jgi:ribosomal-protein-alanine N-acetyltransferase
MRARKLEECILEVRVSNTAAINLYRKLGFEIVSQIPFYYMDGEHAYLMKAKLTD